MVSKTAADKFAAAKRNFKQAQEKSEKGLMNSVLHVGSLSTCAMVKNLKKTNDVVEKHLQRSQKILGNSDAPGSKTTKTSTNVSDKKPSKSKGKSKKPDPCRNVDTTKKLVTCLEKGCASYKRNANKK